MSRKRLTFTRSVDVDVDVELDDILDDISIDDLLEGATPGERYGMAIEVMGRLNGHGNLSHDDALVASMLDMARETNDVGLSRRLEDAIRGAMGGV